MDLLSGVMRGIGPVLAGFRGRCRLARGAGGRTCALQVADVCGPGRGSPEDSARKAALALLLLDGEGQELRLVAQRGCWRDDLSGVQFAPTSPVLRHFASHPIPATCYQLERTPWVRLLSPQERQSMSKLSGGLLVPLLSDEGLAGLLALGPGRRLDGSGRGYSLSPGERLWLAPLLQAAQLYRSRYQGVSQSPHPEEECELRRLERSVSGAGHGLNNALTTILLHATMLVDEGEVSKIREHSDAIRGAALQGARAVRSLQDLAEAPQHARKDPGP